MLDINKYSNIHLSPYYGEYTDYAMMMGSCYCKKSYLRLFNAYNESLDIQINDILMAENLKIGEYTKYVKFPPGSYHIVIYSGENNVVFESDIDIDYNLVYTGLISSDNKIDDICVLMVPEEKAYHMTGNMSALRLANLCGDIPETILSSQDGNILFSDINYAKVSCNVAIPSGRYTLLLKTLDGSDILEYWMDIAPKMHYTLFIVGNYKDNTVKIIVPEDGVNYLDLC